MALLMDGMPKRRGQINEDSLLGMGGDIGMTDSSFQGMGRAPVDELWAGRYAVGIDDVEFSNKEAEAKRIRDIEIANKDWTIEKFMKEGMSQEEAEFAWMGSARERIKDETGLDLYPGDLTRGEKEPQFMQEFSDQGAAFRHGGVDLLRERSADQKPTFLGEMLQHPKLFEQYPEAQFMPVITRPDMTEQNIGGSFSEYRMFDNPEEMRESIPVGLMQLNTDMDDDDLMSTVLHEMQHYISSVEGWENGGMWSPELAKQYIDDQLSYEGQNNMAGDYADFINEEIDGQDGLLNFSRKNNLSEDPVVQRQAYMDLSGEELARAVERRWANNTQGDYFYGSQDKHEEQNWNREGEGIIPLDTIAQTRRDLTEDGLLGALDGKTIRKLVDDALNGEEDENYVGPYPGRRDEHLERMEKRIRELMQ